MSDSTAIGGPTLTVPLDGPPVLRTPKLAHECTVAGIRAIALPPGPVKVAMTFERHALNVIPTPATLDVMRFVGSDHTRRTADRDSVC